MRRSGHKEGPEKLKTVNNQKTFDRNEQRECQGTKEGLY